MCNFNSMQPIYLTIVWTERFINTSKIAKINGSCLEKKRFYKLYIFTVSLMKFYGIIFR